MPNMPTMGKAISVRDPWGPFILYPQILTSQGHPPKIVENRDKDISNGYRGPVFIHKSKEPDPNFYNKLDGCFVRCGSLPRQIAKLLPFGYPEWASEICGPNMGVGGIIGVAQLVDVVTKSSSSWFVGPYGLILEDPQPLPFFPYPGKPWLFDVPTMPILDLLRHYCACCGERSCQEAQEALGTVWCSCAGGSCDGCGKCEHHCLCEILFPDLSDFDDARKMFFEELERRAKTSLRF
jgi:hypothetical protein